MQTSLGVILLTQLLSWGEGKRGWVSEGNVCLLKKRSCPHSLGGQSLSGCLLCKILSHKAKELTSLKPGAHLRTHTNYQSRERCVVECGIVGGSPRHSDHNIQRTGVRLGFLVHVHWASHLAMFYWVESLHNFTTNGQHQLGATPQLWDCEGKLIWVSIETNSEILKQVSYIRFSTESQNTVSCSLSS